MLLPLIKADERREATGIVERLGVCDHFVPKGTVGLGARLVGREQVRINLVVSEGRDQIERGCDTGLSARPQVGAPARALFESQHLRRARAQVGDQAHAIGMVSDDQPVERA